MAMYEAAGEQYKKISPQLTGLGVAASAVLTSDERQMLSKAVALIEKTRSHAEDRMLHDFPELSDDALKIFY